MSCRFLTYFVLAVLLLVVPFTGRWHSRQWTCTRGGSVHSGPTIRLDQDQDRMGRKRNGSQLDVNFGIVYSEGKRRRKEEEDKEEVVTNHL